jgi:tetratricopeptide (TPR) repeat protein
MVRKTDPDMTQPSPTREREASLSDTQPGAAVRTSSSAKPVWPWLIAIPIFALVVFSVAAATGYQIGLDEREVKREQSIAQASQDQFDRGMEDFLAGRYQLAKQRFEYVLELDPNYPQAADMIGKVYEALNEPTPTPSPIASSTPTETPDLGSFEGIFQSAQSAYNRGAWGAALDLLILLRGEAPDYRLDEVNQMMKVALRNRGMDKLFQAEIEQGIYDLNLSERFGPLDNQARSWRQSAQFYLLANSYYGLDWGLTAEYMGQMCVANIWGACYKYGQAAKEYANLLLEQEDFDVCKISFYYAESITHIGDQGITSRATEVGIACMTATAPTPTPTITETPTDTPLATATWAPGPSATPTPSYTSSPSHTPGGGDTSTPTSTSASTSTATGTPSPTATVTVTQTSTGSETP